MDSRQAQEILEAATRLLEQESAFVAEQPLEVRAPQGGRHSWLVPVTCGETIAGFYEFLPDGTYLRFSVYRSDQLFRDWLVPEKRVHCRPGESAGTPYLSYDGSPARIVWAVPVADSSGATRLVFVAGKTAYPAPAPSQPETD